MKEVAYVLLATGLLSGVLGMFALIRRNQYQTMLDDLKNQKPSSALHPLKHQVSELQFCIEMLRQYNQPVFHLCLWTSPFLLLASAATFSMM